MAHPIHVLNLEHPVDSTDDVYRHLFDARLPFDRFNPLDPQPIVLIDDRLRAAMPPDQLPQIVHPKIWILTEIGHREAQRWLSAQTHIAPIVLHTPQTGQDISDWLWERRRQHTKQWQHGVFMEVAGSGVLITGDSGIGKSELALELLSRGHRLIADDAPYFVRGPQGVEGSCPENIRDHLEVRGLGIIDVRALFGDNALKKNKNLRLVIELYPADHRSMKAESRLHGERGEVMICGEPIPLFRLPVAPGRNIAVFVETVVRQHNLERSGFGGRLLGQPYPIEQPPAPHEQPVPRLNSVSSKKTGV